MTLWIDKPIYRITKRRPGYVVKKIGSDKPIYGQRKPTKAKIKHAKRRHSVVRGKKNGIVLIQKIKKHRPYTRLWWHDRYISLGWQHIGNDDFIDPNGEWHYWYRGHMWHYHFSRTEYGFCTSCGSKQRKNRLKTVFLDMIVADTCDPRYVYSQNRIVPHECFEDLCFGCRSIIEKLNRQLQGYVENRRLINKLEKEIARVKREKIQNHPEGCGS
jgi:hypothetical protein